MLDLREILAVPLQELRERSLDPVEVVVVDSGVDATHPDLVARLVAAFSVTSVGGVVSVGETPVGSNQDVFGHGTAVASIIAGIAPNARIVDMRILDPANESTGAMFLAGFKRTLERRSRLINLSLAATARFAPELGACCETAYRQGQIVVAAKRNLGYPDLGFPAEISSTISVDLAEFESAFRVAFLGTPIEFGARGENVVCAAAGGGYTTMTGTSFATPTVTGLCALLLGAYPDLTTFEIKAALKSFASAPRVS